MFDRGSLSVLKNTFIMKTFTQVALLMALGWSGSFASEFKAGKHMTIGEPVKGNLYMAAREISVDAPVSGDIIISGGKLYLNDTIGQDLLSCGGSTIINGIVGGDIRACGGAIEIFNSVGGDLVIFGGTVQIGKKSIIDGDLILLGGRVTINGTVRGNISLAAGEMVFNGIAENDFEAEVGSANINGEIHGSSVIAANQINLGADAGFYKDVRYWTEHGEMDFGEALSGARAIFDPALEVEDDAFSIPSLGLGVFLFTSLLFLSATLIIILLNLLFPDTLTSAASKLKDSFIRSFGYGVLYLVLIPLGSIFLIMIVIGIPLGVLFLVLYAFSLVFSLTIAAPVIAQYINAYYDKKWSPGIVIIVSVALFIVFHFVALIPFLGWLVTFILVGGTFGAIILSLLRPSEKTIVA